MPAASSLRPSIGATTWVSYQGRKLASSRFSKYQLPSSKLDSGIPLAKHAVTNHTIASEGNGTGSLTDYGSRSHGKRLSRKMTSSLSFEWVQMRYRSTQIRLRPRNMAATVQKGTAPALDSAIAPAHTVIRFVLGRLLMESPASGVRDMPGPFSVRDVKMPRDLTNFAKTSRMMGHPAVGLQGAMAGCVLRATGPRALTNFAKTSRMMGHPAVGLQGALAGCVLRVTSTKWTDIACRSRTEHLAESPPAEDAKFV
jgi:hypothetical protein